MLGNQPLHFLVIQEYINSNRMVLPTLFVFDPFPGPFGWNQPYHIASNFAYYYPPVAPEGESMVVPGECVAVENPFLLNGAAKRGCCVMKCIGVCAVVVVGGGCPSRSLKNCPA